MQGREILDHLEWEKELPKLYSKTLILVLTLLFSTLLGAILYIHNMRILGKWQSGIWVALIAILYHWISTSSLYLFSIPSIIPRFLFNLIAALLLAGPVWDKLIGQQFEYQSKSPVFPLLLAIVVAIGMLYAKTFATAIIG